MSHPLILRQIDYRQDNIKYIATSNDPSINCQDLWETPKGDIEQLMEMCWNDKRDHSQIHSLDIETVSWIPKAYEGFVYILGLTSLLDNSIQVHQWINITRKKDGLLPILVDFFKIVSPDSTLVVFNKSFDVPVLKRMIERHGLHYEFPKVIMDPSKLIRKLATFEEEKLGFKRKDTYKEDRQNYSKVFKTRQQIDPYGIYNITDTLTPLLGFLRFEKELLQKIKIAHKIKSTHRRRTPSSLTPLSVLQMRLAQGEISIDEYKTIRSILLKDSKQQKPASNISSLQTSKKIDSSLIEELCSRTSFGIQTLVIRNKKVTLKFYAANEPRCLIALPKTQEDHRKVRNLFPGIIKRRCVIINDTILPRVNHWEISVHSHKLDTLFFRIENRV